MEFLSSYGEENENSGNSLTEKKADMSKESTNSSGDLQAEWESFEKMIGENPVEDKAQYLQDGVVAYPGMSRTRTESSGQKSASGSDVMFSFEVEEEQDTSQPAEISRSSRSRSASASSRSSSRSSKSRSSSASSSDHSDHKASNAKKPIASDVGQKSESHKDEKSDDKRRPSRSSVSPDKRKRSRSRSKSRSPVKKRRSRSRSHSRSRRKHSKRSHGRRGRSSSRSRRRRHRHSRSRSRDRRRRKHRRSSRDRSKDRRHRRKSRSRSRDRKKRSHHRRSRSRSRSKGRSRYSRSRSHERGFRKTNSGPFSGLSTKDKPLTFKEQMRQQLLKASKFLQNGEHAEGSEHSLEMPKEKPSALPLNNQTSILSAMAASVSSGVSSGVTPQMALLQTMAAMHQKAQEMTGVSVPKYYNPAAVNPLKYAEQVQKRKLLWSKNKDKDAEKDKDKEKEWQSTSFVSDSDGKQAAKFRKLMGIKEGEELSQDQESVPKNEEQLKKQQELFSRLDREYEFARMTTHTHRGVGLGFTSTQINPNT